MAKIELKHLDQCGNGDYISSECENNEGEGYINIFGDSFGEDFCVQLDKSTAIKFAKTLRTEINKIQED